MEDEIQSKTYELAYHLNPDFAETEIKAHANELSDIISRSGGIVSASQEPKRTHLSYPIEHKQYAYFGTFDFEAQPEVIEKLNAQMKLQNDVLRYLLTKKTREGKKLRVLGEYRPHSRVRIKTHEQKPEAPSASVETGKTSEEKTKKLEKEIEEIIKGL